MDDIKRVKVDNWGVYFLQKLKGYFNRTDFCDLTLQFQDKSQLKVHRLVLNACTEYFAVLERTCEMYDECLIMPDDLQADVVVPIVNFMYTGHLEFKMDMLDRLYYTSQVLRIPVLTKLLESHRLPTQKSAQRSKSYSNPLYKKISVPAPSSNVSVAAKRSYNKAFENNTSDKTPPFVPTLVKQSHHYANYVNKKRIIDPKPTRYEIPEELESDDLEDSFTNISYESKPLITHFKPNKSSQTKRSQISDSSSREILHGSSTVKIMNNIQSKQSLQSYGIFDDDSQEFDSEEDLFKSTISSVGNIPQSGGQLFDEPLPKVTLETSDLKQSKLDHAKIISEVLKKFPHLVGSNKNIKLKILNTGKATKSLLPLQSKSKKFETMQSEPPIDMNKLDYVETGILDANKAANLISMGAYNVKGPWVCLICGTPGTAILFKSYYTFRRHLVEVHNEKPIMKMCEYCGVSTPKRNYLFHHLLTKHGIEPPSNYSFPKCNMCNYVGLTETLLVKHKVTHTESKDFKCNICNVTFSNTGGLLSHIQKTGHKFGSEKKCDLQCIYCLRVFTRKANLYAHIKTSHKQTAKLDGILEDSDEESQDAVVTNDTNRSSMQYDLSMNYVQPPQETQKILNSEFNTAKSSKVIQSPKIVKHISNRQPQILPNEYSEEISEEHILVTIDGEDYMVKNNQLIPQPKAIQNEEYVISKESHQQSTTNSLLQNPSTSAEFERKPETRYLEAVLDKLSKKTSRNIEQPIQIVVSNDEGYKALMSTNHSIIFDDVETNKTLTVLTTAESADLNSRTIAMNTGMVAQSNEMMILPGNYPLNVSSAVTTNNSNIVLVYSHPQQVPAEFEPAPGVHYERISPGTALVNTDAMEQNPESWQNEIQDTEMETVNEPITLHTNIVHTQSNALENLPEVQLVSQSDLSQNYTQEEGIQTYSVDVEHTNRSENITQDVNGPISAVPMEVVPIELHAVEECETSEVIETSQIQEVTVSADMPQLDENLSASDVHQEINNVQIDTIESSSDMQEISTELTKASLNNIEENSEMLVVESSELTEEEPTNAIEVTLSNEEVSIANHTNHCKNTLDTMHLLQNQPLQATSNESNQDFENVDIGNPSVTEKDLENSALCVPAINNKPETEISSNYEMSQSDFDQQQQVQECVEVSQIAESGDSVIEIAIEPVDTEEVHIDNVVENNTETDTKDIQNDTVNDVIEEIQNSTERVPEAVKEKIQSLTSEWSEDELETSEQKEESIKSDNGDEKLNEIEKSTLIENDISNIVVDVNEIEESIENIQQEMENQMKMDNQQNLKDIEAESEMSNNSNEQPEQISSLLNEWEDNDEEQEVPTSKKDLETIHQNSEAEPVKTE